MNGLKIIQVNLNKQMISSEQMRDICLKDNIDIILVQDPLIINGYVTCFEGCRQILSEDNPEAAIIITNNKIKAIKLGQFTTRYIAVARIGIGSSKDDVVIVSAYFRYNKPTTMFTELLTNISLANRRLLIGADCNGHSIRWHNNSTNTRGKIVEELVDDQDLRIINTPQDLKTYKRNEMGESNIDITLASPSIKRLVRGWTVTDRTDSDHRTLEFTLNLKSPKKKIVNPGTRFRTDKADWDKFRLTLLGLKTNILGDSVDEIACSLTEAIVQAARLSMPKCGGTKTGITTPPWWTDELTESKKSLQRVKREGLPNTNRQAYQQQRNQHLHKIRLAKMSSWREFSADMNTNRWGKAFKWAKSGSRKNPMPTTVKTSAGTYTTNMKDTLDTFLEAFLPEDRNTQTFMPYDHQADDTPPDSTTAQEVKEAIWKMKPDRAPGLDGITAKMLRIAWPVISDSITDLYEKCLKIARFPNCWKTANLVIIPKGKGKNPLLTGSYRPISLLPTLGKALESLITSRLEKETGLNEIGQQHGYVTGRSTETAVKALYDWTDQCPNKIVIGAFLDITGAFDYVRWTPIFERLRVLKISKRTLALLESYLMNRSATLTIDKETRSRQMTRGCPQGSRLGPTLWKVAMSDAFEPMGHQSHMIAYADDIALAVGAARLDTVKKRLSQYFDQLTNWSNKYGLKFSMAKSQIMTLKGGVKPTYTVPFGSSADAIPITATKTVKYLGVIIDPRRSFREHIEGIADKSKEMFLRLRSMTSANWGVEQSTSLIIYKSVFLPRITYAASIWQKALELKCSIKTLGSIQRDALRAITGAYRTTSTAALQVISGQLPLDLEVKRFILRRSLKTNDITQQEYERDLHDLLEVWQERWNTMDKGEWTFQLIPDVRIRYGLPLTMDHYTSQMLTGHGDFRGKLHSFNRVPAPGCACGNGSETVKHVLLACPRTKVQRENLKRKLRQEQSPWPPYDGAIITNKTTYEAFRTFAQESLRQRTDR